MYVTYNNNMFVLPCPRLYYNNIILEEREMNFIGREMRRLANIFVKYFLLLTFRPTEHYYWQYYDDNITRTCWRRENGFLERSTTINIRSIAAGISYNKIPYTIFESRSPNLKAQCASMSWLVIRYLIKYYVPLL